MLNEEVCRNSQSSLKTKSQSILRERGVPEEGRWCEFRLSFADFLTILWPLLPSPVFPDRRPHEWFADN